MQQNKIHRIYFDTELKVSKFIKLNIETKKRLKNILRLKDGSKIIVFNGDGNEYLSTIHYENESNIHIIKLLRSSKSILTKTILAQSIPSYKYMDLAIQKSVEFGVDKIVPLITDRSHPGNHQRKKSHWQKIIIHATEQSNGLFIPTIDDPEEFTNFIMRNKYEDFSKNLFDSSGREINDSDKKNVSRIIIIGPEGGFSKNEIKLAETFNWNIISLGDRILRTETAALVAQVILRDG